MLFIERSELMPNREPNGSRKGRAVAAACLWASPRVIRLNTDAPRDSSGEPRAHRVDDLLRGRHHPDDDEGSPIDNRFAIDENDVLSVMSSDRFHFDPELTAETRRHTDGMQARDSECAIAD
jgi:hypothetical protein